MAEDIQELERKIRAIGDAIATTAQHKHDEALLTGIHWPSRTTLRQNELA
jgi:hypothetical protein